MKKKLFIKIQKLEKIHIIVIIINIITKDVILAKKRLNEFCF